MTAEESSMNAENVMKARPQPLCFGSKRSLVDVIGNRGKTRKWWNLMLKVKEVRRRTIDQYWHLNILTRSHLQNQVKILKMTSLLSRSHLKNQVKVTLKKTTSCPSQNSFHLGDQIPSRNRKKLFKYFSKMHVPFIALTGKEFFNTQCHKDEESRSCNHCHEDSPHSIVMFFIDPS